VGLAVVTDIAPHGLHCRRCGAIVVGGRHDPDDMGLCCVVGVMSLLSLCGWIRHDAAGHVLTSLACVARPMCPHRQHHVVVTAAGHMGLHRRHVVVIATWRHGTDDVTHVPMLPVSYRRHCSMGTWASVVAVTWQHGLHCPWPGHMGPHCCWLRGRY